MGQQEILDFLKKHPKRLFSCKELCDELNISGASGSNALASLRWQKVLVSVKKTPKSYIPGHPVIWFYKHKESSWYGGHGIL